MDIPANTKGDIADTEEIDIAGKVVFHQAFDDGNELYYVEDARGDEIELKIWAGETDEYDIGTGTWYLFRRAKGDVYRGDRKLGSNRGAMEAIELEEPPEFPEIQAGREGAVSGRTGGSLVAIDIETIATVSETELDLDDSSHVELLCIGVGYAPKPGAPGTSDILFRDGPTTKDEVHLLKRLCEYVESRDPDQLLFFKGDFDMTHLRGRTRRIESTDGLEERVGALFEDREILNLDPPGSLEDNLDSPVETHWDIYHHTLEPADWRIDHPQYSGELNDPVVTNKDIPYFGERYLELCQKDRKSREHRALRELIRRYTESDIDPLFELVDTRQ